MTDEELKKASEEYCPDDAYPFGPIAINLEVRKAFIAGAKWMEAHTPLPEDSVAFNKGVEEGKRLMMEEAEEGVVMDFSSNQPRPQVDVYVDPNKYCTGDKVRIIVLKNTEK